MTATIQLKEGTKRRLDDFKMDEMTYDDLLNYFMDTLSKEDPVEEKIKEHYRRLETFRPLSKDDIKKILGASC